MQTKSKTEVNRFFTLENSSKHKKSAVIFLFLSLAIYYANSIQLQTLHAVIELFKLSTQARAQVE